MPKVAPKKAARADMKFSVIVFRFERPEWNQNKELFSYLYQKRKVYAKDKRSHCHFICEKTGRVIHFDVNSIDFLQEKVPRKIKSFQIEVKGELE